MEEAGASFARDDLVAPCPKGVMQIRQPIGAGGGGEAQHVFGNVLAEVDFAEPGVVANTGEFPAAIGEDRVSQTSSLFL
jgi:hypothetical protein